VRTQRQGKLPPGTKIFSDLAEASEALIASGGKKYNQEIS
jgi:hypothetical protein